MGAAIPGPAGFIKPLLAFDADPVGFLNRGHAEYGEIFGAQMGPQQVVSVRGVDAVAAVLRDSDRVFIKDEFTRGLSRLLGDGLLSSEGAHWRQRRKLVAPTLRKGHIQHYAGIFVAHTRRWRASARGELDLHQAMMELTLGIVADALFAAPDAGDVDLIGESVERAMTAHAQHERTWRRLLPGWLPGSPRWVIDRVARQVAGQVDALIAARRTRPAGDDLLWRLLEARDEDGGALDDTGLRDEAVTLFLAGHETTALALTFALHLLGTHPAALERLRAELAPFGDRPLTADDMPALKWTDAVIKEAMRLYPPAWVVGREAVAPVELAGHALAKGTLVLIPICAIHVDPARYPAPAAFLPERWLESPAPGKWDYLPFGGGARVCVGLHFALMEAVLVLATMLQGPDGLRFELLRREPPAVLASITQRPVGGLPARLG